MLLFVAAVAWSLTIAVLLVRAVRQYGYYEILRPDPLPIDAEPPSVAIVVPARNEEQNLPRCLQGLLAMDYPAAQFRLVVVDDHSTDRTADVISQFAQRDSRVRVLHADPLPDGWTGKAHACWQGAAAAGESQWLCFMDADTLCEPALLKTAVREAAARGLGLLSLSPFQELAGPWERLIMPAGFFLIAFTQDLRDMNDPTKLEVHANGQFLLIRREVYDAIGGFAAVARTVSEDSAMARAVKRAGHHVALLGTEGLIRTHMYADRRSLWEGLARQAGELLGSTAACVLWAAGALLLGWTAVLLPLAAMLHLHQAGAHALSLATVCLSLAGSLSLLGTHIGAARYFQIPIIYGILFPVSYTLGAGVLLSGARQRVRRRVLWKGRAYTPASQGTS